MKNSLLFDGAKCSRSFCCVMIRNSPHVVWQKCFPSWLVGGMALSGTMVLFLLGGCVSPERESPSPSQVAQIGSTDSSDITDLSSDNPHAFEVVDCLLPGQVRRLGAIQVFMTQRRPVRATVEDCVIRGGEYVSYDRANLQTSLNVWRKAADSGNADAQYYVATLFERGVTGTPDFAKAASWYQKSAEQDHRQAAMNLGRLYEQGLGLPQSYQEAFVWITKASGLTGESLTNLLNLSATQEIQTLKNTVGTREDKILQLQKTLFQTQEEKTRLGNQVAAQQTATKAEKEKLTRLEEKYQRLQQDLRKVQRQPDREPEIRSYQAQLHILKDVLIRRQEDLQSQDQTIAGLQEELQDLSESQQQTRKLEMLAETRQEEVKKLLAQLLDIQTTMTTVENQLAAQQTATKAEKEKLNRLEEKYQSLQQDLRKVQRQPDREPEIRSYQVQIQVLQDELVHRRQDVDDQDQTIASLQEQLTNLSKSQKKAHILENLAGTRQEEVEKLRAQLVDIQTTMTTVEQQLAQREKVILGEKLKVKEVQNQYQTINLQLGQLQTEKSQQQKQLIQYQHEYKQVEQELKERQEQLTQREAEIVTLAKKLEYLENLPVAIGMNTNPNPGKDLGLEGPTIQIIDPPLVSLRGVQVVSRRRDVYFSPKANRSLTGRVLAPAGLWELRVNGMVINVNKQGIFSFELPMIRTQQSSTPIDIVAVDIQNKRSISSLNIVWGKNPKNPQDPFSLQTQNPFGQYYALVIGNNHYQHWEPLQNAIGDAEAVGNLLESQYGFQVKFLKDASRKDILKTLNEFRKILTEQDNLLIFYAGHGFLEPNIDRGYWIPVDAELEDNSNWVLLPTITDLLQLMSAKHVLVVADSCFAGKLTRSSLAQLRPGLSEEARMELLKTLAKNRVRTALTSGGLRPVLDAGGSGHSIFTEAFLGVLEENREILETERIFLAVRNRVMNAAKRLNTEQIPTYAPIHLAGHESIGDFIFVPKQTPET